MKAYKDFEVSLWTDSTCSLTSVLQADANQSSWLCLGTCQNCSYCHATSTQQIEYNGQVGGCGTLMIWIDERWIPPLNDFFFLLLCIIWLFVSWVLPFFKFDQTCGNVVYCTENIKTWHWGKKTLHVDHLVILQCHYQSCKPSAHLDSLSVWIV